ncbi:imelysin family protein [Jiella marina]|uniref:imelysin family protein n=1 Tax=Jiella sp. LLJ827 TaxID=2917712 RepID=UPI002101D16F|nr:imelysin family protein [Jiella sp. LLJ827]MCQ0988177.1 peptidase M75, Imelysin [Jiella sp. LLJ827]
MLLGAVGAVAQEDGPPDPSTATAEEKLQVVQNAIDGAIRPGYAAFSEAADESLIAMEALCAAPGESNLDNARQSFAELVDTWSRIEFVRFGPIMEDNRIDRILFFPDRRGIGLRQVQGILGNDDKSAATAESLADKSVAVQGLGALGFVLFGSDAETLATGEAAFRCQYGQAIAGNLATIAAAVEAGWANNDEGVVARLTQPKSDDPAYRSADDSLKEIVGIFINGFEAVRDLRLTPPLGETAERARPKLFLFHRADLSLASLEANFAGMKDLFVASNVASLLPEQQAYLKDSILFEFANAATTFEKLAPPLSEVVTTPEKRQNLTYLLIVTDSLQSQFANQLSPTLGLSAGFSALDGD